jgi:hypothetical protein
VWKKLHDDSMWSIPGWNQSAVFQSEIKCSIRRRDKKCAVFQAIIIEAAYWDAAGSALQYSKMGLNVPCSKMGLHVIYSRMEPNMLYTRMMCNALYPRME